MKTDAESEATFKRYLLGKISGEELTQLEMRLLTDGEFFDQLQVAEEELVDDYLEGALSSEDRREFEASFLSTPAGYEQVELARSLKEYAQNRYFAKRAQQAVIGETSQSWWRMPMIFFRSRFKQAGYMLPVLALLLLLMMAWLTRRALQLQSEVDRLHAEQAASQRGTTELQGEIAELNAKSKELTDNLQQERERSSILDQQLADLRTKPKEDEQVDPLQRLATLTVMLDSGSVRSSIKRKTLMPGPDLERVTFRLKLRADDYKRYKAVLESDNGQAVWTEQSLKPQTTGRVRSVPLTVPAESLPSGDYVIRLSGVTDEGRFEDIGSYYFRVLRK